MLLHDWLNVMGWALLAVLAGAPVVNWPKVRRVLRRVGVLS